MNVIPPITDEMGRYWEQPDRSEIEVDATHALMSRATLDKLIEYSSSIPSGTYTGKMWKRKTPTGWFLCWYGEVNGDRIMIHNRAIICA